MNYDWMKIAFPSTNSALNLRTSIIQDVVINAGFYDKKYMQISDIILAKYMEVIDRKPKAKFNWHNSFMRKFNLFP